MADTGRVFSVKELIGKEMFAAKKLTAYFAYPGSKDTFTYDRGQSVGNLLSYVHGGDVSTLWFMFDTPASMKNTNPLRRSYYIKFEQGNFDLNAILDQGAKSEKQKQEDKDKENRDAKYYLETYGIPVGIGMVGIWGIAKIISATKKN